MQQCGIVILNEKAIIIIIIIISERELITHVHVRYMSSSVRLSVCLSSVVCNVRAPYSAD